MPRPARSSVEQLLIDTDRRAEQLFALADTDHDGILSADERARFAPKSRKAATILAKSRTIPDFVLPKLAPPQETADAVQATTRRTASRTTDRQQTMDKRAYVREFRSLVKTAEEDSKKCACDREPTGSMADEHPSNR